MGRMGRMSFVAAGLMGRMGFVAVGAADGGWFLGWVIYFMVSGGGV